jgi:DNA-binding MarR family transcriptional regulator
MPEYPPLSTWVIGQTESALGAVLKPLLAEAGITFDQWLVLAVTTATGAALSPANLISRIRDARKVDEGTVASAIAELTAAGLATSSGPVRLTEAGQATYLRIRGRLTEITTQLFDVPAEDLAAAGRILGIVTARAGALIDGGMP